MNYGKIILDLCGGTGAWSRPYYDAGYDVRLITLPSQNIIDYIPPKDVYGILAAPPCTMFSLARTRATTPRDFIQGMGPVNGCYRIALQTSPRFFALENPVGLLAKYLGPARYKFDPWQFGDPYTKRTWLWGWFNNPVSRYHRIKDVMDAEQIEASRETRNAKLPSISELTSSTRADLRAITPSGFAQAFSEANP